MALLTANDVMTQVPCSELTPRLPEIVGKATLAMVVSSTCMKVANDRPMVLSSRLGGVKDAFELIANPWKRGRCRDAQVAAGLATQRCAVFVAVALFSWIRRVISASASASCCPYTSVLNEAFCGGCWASTGPLWSCRLT